VTDPSGASARPAIVVVTGIQAAGKSTISRLLAMRFARAAYIEADALQRMIVSGGEWIGEPGEPQGEVARQLRLRLKHMCLLGISFYEASFTAVLDDIILGERWQHLQEDLRGYPFSLVALAPHVEAVLTRDNARSKSPLGAAWATYLDHILRTSMAGIGLWVDSSHQAPEETVAEILRCLPEGMV
jgi:hypothetical protein